MVAKLIASIVPSLPVASPVTYTPPTVELNVKVRVDRVCSPPAGVLFGLKRVVKVTIGGNDYWGYEPGWIYTGACAMSGDHSAYCSCCTGN